MTEKEAIRILNPETTRSALWGIGRLEAIKIVEDACNVAVKALEEVQEYMKAEEQGMLLRLPCKVGEKIYCIEEYEDGCEYSIYLFVASCKDFVIVAPKYSHHDNFGEQLEEMCEESQEWSRVSFEMFPRNKVFLTKEEAEAALERMKENEH